MGRSENMQSSVFAGFCTVLSVLNLETVLGWPAGEV